MSFFRNRPGSTWRGNRSAGAHARTYLGDRALPPPLATGPLPIKGESLLYRLAKYITLRLYRLTVNS